MHVKDIIEGERVPLGTGVMAKIYPHIARVLTQDIPLIREELPIDSPKGGFSLYQEDFLRPTNRRDNIIIVDKKSEAGNIAIAFEYPTLSITEPNTKLNPISNIDARETTIVVALALIELGTQLFDKSVSVG